MTKIMARSEVKSAPLTQWLGVFNNAWLNETPVLVVAKLTTMKTLQAHYLNQQSSEAGYSYFLRTFLRCHTYALMDPSPNNIMSSVWRICIIDRIRKKKQPYRYYMTTKYKYTFIPIRRFGVRTNQNLNPTIESIQNETWTQTFN